MAIQAMTYSKKTYNTDHTELNYIGQHNDEATRKYQFDNLTFACLRKGAKQISTDNENFIDFGTNSVLIAKSRDVFYSRANAEAGPTECFTIEISNERITSLLNHALDFDSFEKEGIFLERELGLKSFKQTDELFLSHNLINIFKAHCSDLIYKDKLIATQLDSLVLGSFQLNWMEQLSDDRIKNSNAMSYVLDYVRQNLDKSHSTGSLADMALMSRATFFRRFKQLFGKTPVQFIINERLKKGNYYIHFTNKSVSEISSMVGFVSESYFIQAYKKKYGDTPLQARMKSKATKPLTDG